MDVPQSTCMSDAEVESVLLGPYNYITQIPGKQVRTKLAQAFNHWLNVDEATLKQIGSVTEMLHNSSLLIDDIEDSSTLRRGKPVTHNIYGVPTTLNSANYMYFIALNQLLQLGKPEAAQIFTEQLIELHRGQGMDIYWRDSYYCPSEKDYRIMVNRKTGGLFGLAVRLMQLFSLNQMDLKKVTEMLGLYFQIRDDYANLKSSEYEQNKSYCEDLTEGKFSFPIIYAIHRESSEQSSLGGGQVMSIVRQRTEDVDVKKYAVKRMEELGAFVYTKSVLVDLEESLSNEIEKLGGNPYLTKIVSDLSKLYKQ